MARPPHSKSCSSIPAGRCRGKQERRDRRKKTCYDSFMWTIEELREEYDRLDRYLGIDTRPIRLRFSARMQRQHGVCCFQNGWPVEIRIAEFLRDDDAAFLETARHEYAHAAAAIITGTRHGHDALWRGLCERIGCRPERLAEVSTAQQAALDSRGYIVCCCRCGATSRYLRRSRVIHSIETGQGRCRCRRCGGEKFTIERIGANEQGRTGKGAF